jgi:hypothetical protein
MSTAATNLPATADTAAELEMPLPCPLCGYDLRGLPEQRCPECGHAFNLLELRRAQQRAAERPLPWLIEYPPDAAYGPERNALLTQLLTLNPWWFWRRLRPTMRINQPRLRLYAETGWLITAAGLALAIALEPPASWLMKLAAYYLTLTDSGPESVSTWGNQWELSDRLISAIAPVVVMAVWPWLTLGILACFRMSLRQARVRPGHLLRCVTYSADLAIPAAILLLVGSWLITWWTPGGWGNVSLQSLFMSLGLLDWFGWFVYQNQMPSPLAGMTLLVLLWFAVRLCIAYRRYLAFPHAIATVISSQVILWLVLVIVWMQLLALSMGP